ncbi:MAG: hypothetical protein Q9174_006477, partial [Haloplaca sp. 1 TL-2023]
MGFADIVARARAGSILRSPPTQDTPISEQLNEKPLLSEKQQGEGANGRGPRISFNSNTNPPIDRNVPPPKDPHPAVRTVPTWVHVLDEDDEELTQPTTSLLPSSPPGAQVAQHHYHPFARSQNQSKAPRDRLDNQDREEIPHMPSRNLPEHTSRWREYLNASAYPVVTSEGGKRVTPEWLAQNGPDYSQPWMAGADEGDVGNTRRRKVWWKRLHRTIIRSPMIPLILRSTVWVFSLVALAIAATIYRRTPRLDKEDAVDNNASALMAIIVDAVALAYLLYITYDEYSGKPLGLRSARAKMRLIFLDLFFIVFDSANLSLAFEAIDSTSECAGDSRKQEICRLQDALSSVLLIALIAWIITFSISVL